MRNSKEIRGEFIEFFNKRGHRYVPSAPVIPHGDPTLLFTNAGMNQFKDIFLGIGSREYSRAVNSQKCIRVSGKHNDLEEVGRDTYHHTFFEMLGNWSFGDYYKKEAVGWAWELLTGVWKIPKERLWATVHNSDDEAISLWQSETDINPSHILRFGDKDNFWEMGDTGPCGPCSEIHMDVTPGDIKDSGKTAGLVNGGDPNLIELWNLVFIQYNKNERGELEELPDKHVDTGMGFERLCAVLLCMEEGFKYPLSNFNTDIFTPIIRKIIKITGKDYDRENLKTAMRVIADHLRALTFAIGDGAVPSNEGRGYVLRRILRRSARFGRELGMHEPFIYRLVPTLSQEMGDIFPEIIENQTTIERIIKSEEEGFNLTLDRGLEIFEETINKVSGRGLQTIPGEDVFKLYDTYGFPIDLTALLARERGFQIDEEGFNDLMKEQRERSRDAKSGKITGKDKVKEKFAIDTSTEFIGYGELECRTRVLASGENRLILERTPFYAEEGGQVGDTGEIKINGETYRVVDTQKKEGIYIHILERQIEIPTNKIATVRVDRDRRVSIQRHHSATHIVHEALRQVLGTHVHQQGSLVAPDRLRFDFPHFSKINPEEIRDIETIVNEKIKEAIPVEEEILPLDRARTIPNVKMFFGEKYGETVRVVFIERNFSAEFCGGTHVQRTDEIGLFKIIHETGIASGVRRIEAICGEEIKKYLTGQLAKVKEYDKKIEYLLAVREELESELQKQSNISEKKRYRKPVKLEVIPIKEMTPGTIEKAETLLTERERLSGEVAKEVRNLQKKLNLVKSRESFKYLEKELEKSISLNGLKYIPLRVNAESMDELKSLGDFLISKIGSGIGLLGAVIDNKAALLCIVTDDLIKTKHLEAGKIVREVAKLVDGGGGGRAHLATAGGKSPEKLTDALRQAEHIIRKMLIE